MTAFKDWLNGLTSKTTPVDADEVYVRDSSGTPSSKKLTWANVKATLKSYFDTVYVPGGSTTQIQFNDGGVFAGNSDLVWNKTNNVMTINGMLCSPTGTMLKLSAAANTTNYVGAVTYQSIQIKNSSFFGWTADSFGGAADDLRLNRDGADALALRRQTNAQTHRVYGTYTDASNYRRVAIAMTTAGVASITPEGAGTGASGNVLHISGLPTSNPGAGILWNDSGTVKVGT